MDVIQAHAAAIAGMTAVVDGIRDDQLDASTPCSEWNVRQLLRHIIVGNERWAAAADGRSLDFTDPLGDEIPDGELKRRIHESAEAVDRGWRRPGVLDRTFDGPQGEVPGARRLTVHVGELVMHGWDLARATGQTATFPDEIVEMFIGFAEQMPRERPPGYPFASPREAHPEASPIDRLAALMGRDV
jgi:uncharacterized protein (TIGR03086 family)